MIRKWKDSTYNLRLRTVRSFFRYCTDQGYVDGIRAAGSGTPRTAYIMQPVLTAEQRELIRRRAGPSGAGPCGSPVSSGMRVSE